MIEKAFVISPYRGDIKKNLVIAKRLCKHIAEWGCNPICPHLYYTSFLDDDLPEEREQGIKFGHDLMRICDKAIVLKGKISEGMKEDIEMARKLQLPIFYVKIEEEIIITSEENTK